VRLFCCNAVHSSRSKIVLDFHEGGSRPGSKSHEAAGIHQAFQQHGGRIAADSASAAGGNAGDRISSAASNVRAILRISRLTRRNFFTLLGAGPLVWPCAVAAQSTSRVRKIGMFWAGAESDPEMQRRFASLLKGLRQLGWSLGRNIEFELRFADGSPDRFPSMAMELVQANVELIITGTAGLAAIVRKITNTIPILTFGGDLEGIGLIANIRKPEGNITGIQGLHPELMSKRIGLLQELVPTLVRLGVVEPITPSGIITAHYLEVIADAARALGIEVHRVQAHGPDEFATAYATMVKEGDQAAIVITNPLSLAHRNEIITSAARSRLATMYETRVFVAAGGLVSYGNDLIDVYRQLARYVDAILRGAAPADLPVQQPTKFELVINLKTAKLLSLAIPPTLIARADETIE